MAEEGKGVVIPPTITLARPTGGAQVILVGAGGTGARVAGALIKLLRRPDHLTVVDPDTIEEKNLERQHFVERDLGKYKAEVVVDRLRGEARRKGVEVEAIISPFGMGMIDGNSESIIIGCVDNRKARKSIWDAIGARGVRTRVNTFEARRVAAWIDVGNELRTGQVALTLSHWPVTGVKSGDRSVDWTGVRRNVHAWTLPLLYPEMIEGEKEAEGQVACADRLDLQSVSANALAAAWAVTALTWVLDEIPISIVGQTFSTLGGGAPLPMLGVTQVESNYTVQVA